MKSTVSESCGTPFHEMTAALSQTTWWYGWNEYVMPDVYSDPVSELSAIRERVAMIDMSPLPKIEITGPDAEKFIDYLTVRKTTKNVVGHVLYTAWCTHKGDLISDGLVFRHAEDRYILGVDNCLVWIQSNMAGFDVSVRNCTHDYGILSLQGPSARDVLEQATGEDWSDFAFCRIRATKIGGVNVNVARQGFTGEIGYELWIERKDGSALWQAVYEAGKKFGVQPVGEYALDIARTEAGLTLASADYTNAGPDPRGAHVVISDDNVSTPMEVGLGKLVHFDKGDFIGRDALLKRIEANEITRQHIGIVVNWQEVAALFASLGELPEVSPRVRWDTLRIVDGDRVIGRATSITWSPTLSQMIGFATIENTHAELGTKITIEWADQWGVPKGCVSAEVVEYPFLSLKRASD